MRKKFATLGATALFIAALTSPASAEPNARACENGQHGTAVAHETVPHDNHQAHASIPHFCD